MKDQRNLILAVVLTGLLLVGWEVGMRWLYPQPEKPAVTQVATKPAKPTREGGLSDPAAIALEKQDLKTVLESLHRELSDGVFTYEFCSIPKIGHFTSCIFFKTAISFFAIAF